MIIAIEKKEKCIQAGQKQKEPPYTDQENGGLLKNIAERKLQSSEGCPYFINSI